LSSKITVEEWINIYENNIKNRKWKIELQE
jgi:hypothetical protein